MPKRSAKRLPGAQPRHRQSTPPMNSDRSTVVTRPAGPDAWTIVIWVFVGLALFCSGGLAVYIVVGMPTEGVQREAGQSGPELVRPAPPAKSIEEPAVEIPPPATVDEEPAVEIPPPATLDEEPAVPISSPPNSLQAPPLDEAPSEPPAPIGDVAVLPRDTVVDVKAFSGEPFGVGKITVDFPEGNRPTWYADQFIHLEGGRTLYPAFDVRHALLADESRSKVDRYECYFPLNFRSRAEFLRIHPHTCSRARLGALYQPRCGGTRGLTRGLLRVN